MLHFRDRFHEGREILYFFLFFLFLLPTIFNSFSNLLYLDTTRTEISIMCMQTKHIKLFHLLGSSSLGVNSPKITLGSSQFLRCKTRGVVTSFATVCNPCFSYGKWNIFKKVEPHFSTLAPEVRSQKLGKRKILWHPG